MRSTVLALSYARSDLIVRTQIDFTERLVRTNPRTKGQNASRGSLGGVETRRARGGRMPSLS